MTELGRSASAPPAFFSDTHGNAQGDTVSPSVRSNGYSYGEASRHTEVASLARRGPTYIGFSIPFLQSARAQRVVACAASNERDASLGLHQSFGLSAVGLAITVPSYKPFGVGPGQAQRAPTGPERPPGGIQTKWGTPAGAGIESISQSNGGGGGAPATMFARKFGTNATFPVIICLHGFRYRHSQSSPRFPKSCSD
jgi:hypothetical protein